MPRLRPRPRMGTTSACAENTIDAEIMPASSGNYLRVRGEYSSFSSLLRFIAELPPRARRIHRLPAGRAPRTGTTSACAENTLLSPGRRCRRWNYLRVRGEYQKDTERKTIMQELPPRARRILGATPFPLRAIGTTSACAENTAVAAIYRCCRGNYLRVRGEY